MATTGQPIHELISGAVTSAGVAVASGNARFYNTGGLVAATVYSDAACTTAYTQPIVLDAGGRKVGPQIWAKTVVRMILKDAADSATILDVDPLNIVRAEQVFVTNAAVNGGAETDLNTLITGSSLATYKESANATTRAVSTRFGEIAVSVMDFAATGDGSTDDTSTIQAAIDRVAARGGGWVEFPKGTFKISAALTISSPGIKLRGAGVGVTIIRNTGAAAHAIDATYSGTEFNEDMILEGFSIEHSSSSTGDGVHISNDGSRFVIRDLHVVGHLYGIRDVSAVSTFSARSLIDRVTVKVANSGTGIYVAGGRGTTVSGAVIDGNGGTAFSCLQATDAIDTLFIGCHVYSGIRGINIDTANLTRVIGCTMTSNTNGLVVTGSSTDVGVLLCRELSSTTGLSVGSNCNGFLDFGNSWSSKDDSASIGHTSPRRVNVQSIASSASSFTATPDFTTSTTAAFVVSIVGSYAAGAQALTIAAPTASDDVTEGGVVEYVLTKTGANAMNLTWAANYKAPDATTMAGPTSVASDTSVTVRFRKTGTSYITLSVSAAVAT